MATPVIAAHRRESRVAVFLFTLRTVLAVQAKRVIAPHKVSLARLWEIPLTVIGLGCIDFAAFHLAHGWGWLVTGISLILLELLITEDTE